MRRIRTDYLIAGAGLAGSDIRKRQFRRRFFIMRKGEPVVGNVILTGK